MTKLPKWESAWLKLQAGRRVVTVSLCVVVFFSHLAHTSGRGWTRCNRRDQRQETFPFWRRSGRIRPDSGPPVHPCLLPADRWLFLNRQSPRLNQKDPPSGPVRRLSTRQPPGLVSESLDTQALLLIPLISTASAAASSPPAPPPPSSSSQPFALNASCSAFHATGFTCQLQGSGGEQKARLTHLLAVRKAQK